MKFAVPSENGKLATHFGHCKKFAFLTVNIGSCPIIQKSEAEAPPHEPGALPVWLHENGITHVIAGGIGQRAKNLLEERKIQVMVGASQLEPEKLVQHYINDILILGNNACDH